MDTAALARTPEFNPLAKAATTEDQLLAVTFRIGPQHYGLPVAVVIEIVRLPALLSLAGAPSAVIGLINLRGSYVPVIDGSILVGETPHYDLNSQIIIAGRIGETSNVVPVLGLRVDQVADVRTLDKTLLTRLDQSVAASFLQGVINAGQESILMFDIEVLKQMVPEAPQPVAELP